MITRGALVGLLALLCHVTGSDVVKRATDLANLTATVHSLSDRVDLISDELNELKANATHQFTQISSLSDEVDKKDDLIHNLTRALNMGDRTLRNLDADCRSSVADIQQQISGLQSTVAFTVRFSNDSVGELTAPATGPGYTPWNDLRFDLVQFQIGGENYNTSTGVFIAPSGGTYAFFLTLQRNDPTFDECLEAAVMSNARDVKVTVAACPPGYTAASNMALTSLNAGDHVHVRIRSPETPKLMGYVHSTFSGFKLN